MVGVLVMVVVVVGVLVMVVVVVGVLVVVVVVVLALVVVAVLSFVPVPTHAEAGPVVVPLDPAAELHAVAAEVQLLVGEGGKRVLVGPRRQRLDAGRLEIAELHPGAEAARQPVRPLLIDVGPHDPGPVREPGADALHAVIDLDFVVVPVDDVQGDTHPLHHPVVQVAEADVEPADTPAGVEVDVLRFFFLRCAPVVVVVVIVVAVIIPVTVEHARERDAVAAVLGDHAAAGEQPVAEPADTRPHVRQPGRRVLHRARRRLVVVAAAHASAPPENGAAARVQEAGVRPRLPVRAARVRAELRPRAVEQRFAVALVRRDDVDEAADGVRPVQQRRRPAHDLDPLGAGGIDRHAMVARRARQVARADPVLQDQHPVVVEAADDRPARAGTEAPAGDAGLVLQGVAEAPVQILHEVERVERRHRVERLERRLRAGRGRRHGHVLVHRRQAELEIDRGRTARVHGDRLPAGREMLALGEHFVHAGRHVRDAERAVLVGQSDQAGPDDQDHGAVHRAALLRQRDGALHDTGRLGRGRRRRQHGQRESRRQQRVMNAPVRKSIRPAPFHDASLP